MKFLGCRFSCSVCGVKDAEVSVPERTESQDVRVWMEKACIPAVASAHRLLSPHCMATELSQVAIPASERGVGFIPEAKA